MLFFERYGKTVYDTAQDFEEFGDAVELFDFVHESEENVVDLLADEGAQAQKFAVYAM